MNLFKKKSSKSKPTESDSLKTGETAKKLSLGARMFNACFGCCLFGMGGGQGLYDDGNDRAEYDSRQFRSQSLGQE